MPRAAHPGAKCPSHMAYRQAGSAMLTPYPDQQLAEMCNQYLDAFEWYRQMGRISRERALAVL